MTVDEFKAKRVELVIQCCDEGCRVFPAHAGVIPRGALRLCPCRCFPRMRGGDAGGKGWERCCEWFSPHTRG